MCFGRSPTWLKKQSVNLFSLCYSFIIIHLLELLQYFVYFWLLLLTLQGIKWKPDEHGVIAFDCRNRKWYIQAATSPKDVVILVDVSGSMKGLRLTIARQTVSSILDTLGDDDFFNIIAVSTPKCAQGCEGRIHKLLYLYNFQKFTCRHPHLFSSDQRKCWNKSAFSPVTLTAN